MKIYVAYHTSGNDLFPAITKNSTALSTQPESDIPGSITGNSLSQNNKCFDEI